MQICEEDIDAVSISSKKKVLFELKQKTAIAYFVHQNY